MKKLSDDSNKIVKLETFHNPFVGFVRMTCKDGKMGIGQISTYHSDITAEVFHRQIAPWVLGEDADNIDALIAKVEDKEHKFPGSYRYRALAGLDTAIWDWKGKKQGAPVVSLLGGKAGKLDCYASSMKRDISPEDEAKRFLKLRDKYGFKAFKWRVGSECGHDKDEWEGRTEKIVPLVSKALGDNILKLVDANSCYSPQKAIEIGHLLIDNGITHFEEPCPYWHFSQTKTVRDALDSLPIDITGGEQDWDLAHWENMIKLKVVDIVQPDVMYMGGISRTLKVAKMAQKANLPVTPHSANLSMVTLCTMHLLKAIPNPGKYLEFSIEEEDYYPWQKDLFLEDIYKIEDGKVTISERPGFGVTIHPSWLEKSVYKQSALQ